MVKKYFISLFVVLLLFILVVDCNGDNNEMKEVIADDNYIENEEKCPFAKEGNSDGKEEKQDKANNPHADFFESMHKRYGDLLWAYPKKERYEIKVDGVISTHAFKFGRDFQPEFTRFGKLSLLSDNIIPKNSLIVKDQNALFDTYTYVVRGSVYKTYRSKYVKSKRPKIGYHLETGDIAYVKCGNGVVLTDENKDIENDAYVIKFWLMPNETKMRDDSDLIIKRHDEENFVENSLNLLVASNNDMENHSDYIKEKEDRAESADVSDYITSFDTLYNFNSVNVYRATLTSNDVIINHKLICVRGYIHLINTIITEGEEEKEQLSITVSYKDKETDGITDSLILHENEDAFFQNFKQYEDFTINIKKITEDDDTEVQFLLFEISMVEVRDYHGGRDIERRPMKTSLTSESPQSSESESKTSETEGCPYHQN